MTGELLQRYLNGVTNSAENKEVLDWAEKDAANRNDLKILRKIYDALLCNSNSFVPIDSEPGISDMQKTIAGLQYRRLRSSRRQYSVGVVLGYAMCKNNSNQS